MSVLSGLLATLGLGTASADEISADQLVSYLTKSMEENPSQIRLEGEGLAEWDDARVIGPYTPISDLPGPFAGDARLGATGIESLDSITVLAFLRGGEIIAVVSVPRGVIDFSPLADQTIHKGQCIKLDGRKAAAIESCS
jgi:hypothetical protein